MKKLIHNFIHCGILGWCMEITFTAFFPQTPVHLKGHYLHLDVSHLRHGLLPGSPVPSSERQKHPGTGICLCVLHLFGRIHHRKTFEEKRYLPLGLFQSQMERGRDHPSRLCSELVSGRSFI